MSERYEVATSMHSVLLLALVMYFPNSIVDPFLLVLTLNSKDVYKGEKEKAVVGGRKRHWVIYRMFG